MSYKVKYTLRKSRKMRVLMPVMFMSIAGSIFLSSNVQAHENIITDNPATNAKSSQPPTTLQAQKSQNNANQIIGYIDVSSNNNNLNQVVNIAKNQGLTINKDVEIDHGIINDDKENQAQQNIQLDYQQQIDSLKQDMTKYQQQMADY